MNVSLSSTDSKYLFPANKSRVWFGPHCHYSNGSNLTLDLRSKRFQRLHKKKLCNVGRMPVNSNPLPHFLLQQLNITFQPGFAGPSTLAFLSHASDFFPHTAFCPSPAHPMTNLTPYAPFPVQKKRNPKTKDSMPPTHICSKILPTSINLGSLLPSTSPQGCCTSQKENSNRR